MLKTALAILVIGSMAAWGQAPGDTSASPASANRIDRAAAYYHFTMAVRYAKLAAASGGRNREYVNKAFENYQAAIQADPQTKELLEVYAKGPTALDLPSVPRITAP